MQVLKKIISLLLCVTICMGALAGCALTEEGWDTTPIVSDTSSGESTSGSEPGGTSGTGSSGEPSSSSSMQGEPGSSNSSDSGSAPSSSSSQSTNGSEPGQGTSPAPDQLLFAQNKTCVYQIIAVRGEMWEPALNRLENALRAYGISCTVKYYSKYQAYDASTKQILLGEMATFPETVTAHENLRPTDNRISMIGNKLCLVAGSADSALGVVEYFIEQYLDPAFADTTLTDADAYIHYADYVKTYTLETVTLGGVPIQNYTIVYNTSDSLLGIYNTYLTNSSTGQKHDYVNKNNKIEVYGGDCLADAELLRDTIAELYGWQLEIKPDTDPETQYEILLPGVNRTAASTLTNVPTLAAMHSYGKYMNGKLIFTSYGTFSMRNTGKGFANYFKSIVDGKTLDIPATFAQDISCLDIDYFERANGTTVRFVTSNIAAAAYNWGGFSDVDAKYRKEILIAEFAALDADVYGIQEVCPTWATIIKEVMSDEYVIVNEKSVGKNGSLVENNNFILYRKSMFTEVAKCDTPVPYDMYVNSSGAITDNAGAKIRQVNWVVLKHNATGQTFGYANSHWDWKQTAWTDPKTGTEYPVYQAYQSLQYASIMNEVSEKYNCPMFACADFNCRPYEPTAPDDPTYLRIFTEKANMINSYDAAKQAGVLLNDTGSTHGFPNREIEPEYYSSIDHIIYMPWDCIEILAYRTIIENSQLDLSDHVPRYIDIKFEATK